MGFGETFFFKKGFPKFSIEFTLIELPVVKEMTQVKNTEKKRMSKWKIALIVIGILLLLLLIPVIILSSSLLVKYNTTSYEYVAPTERVEEYVMPEYPEIVLDTEGTWEEGVDLTPDVPEQETAELIVETEPAQETEPLPEETELPPETEVQPETEAVTEETEKAPETQTIIEKVPAAEKTPSVPAQSAPSETLPPVINTPSAAPTYTAPSNPDASFANSIALSVYGKTPIYKVNQKNPDIKNILVMGTDTRDVTADRGRSDSTIIVSYNKKTGSIKLTSLLRDSLVPIEGHGWNRINTAYFYDGVGLAINTVNQLYGLDIQDFIVIDFNGTKNFIDYIGGVDVTLTAEEAELYSAYSGRDISAGLTHMDSTLALTHMRNRTIGSDFGRTQRQRDTITAIIKQIASKKSLNDLYGIVDYSFSLIKTNISATDLLSLATSILSNASSLSIESENVPFSDAYQFAWYNGMAILSYDIGEAAVRLNNFIYGD